MLPKVMNCLNKEKTLMHSRLTMPDVSFFLWMATEYIMPHSLASNICLLAFCGLNIIKKNNNKIKFNSTLAIYILFVFVCYLKINDSIMPYLSQKMVKTLILNLIFMIAMFRYIMNERIDHFKNVFAFCSIIISLILLCINVVLHGTLILRDNSEINANALAVCDAIAACWVICSDKISKKNLASISILIIFCLLAGTRKALLAIFIGVFIYIALKKPSRITVNIMIIFMILIVSYNLMMNVEVIYNLIGYRFESLFNLLQGESGASSEETRQQFIKLGMLYFKERPFTGYGLDTFRILPGSYGTYSHNNYVELLYGVGIVGTCVYYFMYLDLLIRFIHRRFTNANTLNIIAISFIMISLMIDYAMVTYYERASLSILVIIATINMKFKASNQV